MSLSPNLLLIVLILTLVLIIGVGLYYDWFAKANIQESHPAEPAVDHPPIAPAVPRDVSVGFLLALFITIVLLSVMSCLHSAFNKLNAGQNLIVML